MQIITINAKDTHMTYSICYGYSPVDGRAEATRRAAEGWVHWSAGKHDLEFSIVFDVRSGGMPSAALDLLWPHFSVRTSWATHWGRCSSRNINCAAAQSSGDRIILASPEVMPNADVIGALDQAYAVHPDDYHVLSVAEAGPDGRFHQWLQHSRHNPRRLHFLSSMSRECWARIGGMDERYCHGIAYEDNALVQRIMQAGISISQWDMPEGQSHGMHMHHSRSYQAPELVEHNRQLYIASEQSGDWGAPL